MSDPLRRAPRLRPDERLAPYITRRGRFRKLDPAKGRALPAVSHWFAFGWWTFLLLAAFRRARNNGRGRHAGSAGATP